MLTVDAPFGAGFTASDELLAGYAAAVARVCRFRGNRCGPILPDYIDRTFHYEGTDGVHPNQWGHIDMAAAFSMSAEGW